MTDATTTASNTATEEKKEAAPAIPMGQRTSDTFAFHFRTDKLRDDEGKVLGTGRKHPTVNAVLPVPTYQQMISWLQAAIANPEGTEGVKESQLMLEALYGEIDGAARAQINEFRETQGLDKDFTPTAFDLSKLSVTAIANMPKSERGGPEISDEDWTAFLTNYSHVMVHVVGYEESRVKLHVAHFKAQLRRVKNDKASVRKLLDMLNVYAEKASEEDLENNMEPWKFLTQRADKYLKAEEKNLLEAL